MLLLRYLEEVNQLRKRPQSNNAMTDNCTTAVQRLARSSERRSWRSWKLIVAANDDPRCSVWIRGGLPRMPLDHGDGVTR
jgi:hypothetical protein